LTGVSSKTVPQGYIALSPQMYVPPTKVVP